MTACLCLRTESKKIIFKIGLSDSFLIFFTIYSVDGSYTLSRMPKTFKVDALGGATFTLGWKSGRDYGYTLCVDETKFEELPEYKEVI